MPVCLHIIAQVFTPNKNLVFSFLSPVILRRNCKNEVNPDRKYGIKAVGIFLFKN